MRALGRRGDYKVASGYSVYAALICRVVGRAAGAVGLLWPTARRFNAVGGRRHGVRAVIVEGVQHTMETLFCATSHKAIDRALTADLMRISSAEQGLTASVSRVGCDGDFTEYVIVTRDKDGRTVATSTTRYSKVLKLLQSLKRRGVTLPEMPGKRVFGSLEASVVQEREEGLNQVLKAMVPSYAGLELVRRFLGMPSGRVGVARRATTSEETGSQEEMRSCQNEDDNEHTK